MDLAGIELSHHVTHEPLILRVKAGYILKRRIEHGLRLRRDRQIVRGRIVKRVVIGRSDSVVHGKLYILRGSIYHKIIPEKRAINNL